MSDSETRRPAGTGWALLLGALAGPLLLTVLRLTQPLSTWAVELVGLAPLALPLYAVVVVVAGVPVVRRRGRTRYAVPAAVAVVGLVLHAVWFAPQVSGEADRADRADRAAPAFTVMASNLLRGGADAAALLRVARERDVDVLVTEEITPGALARLRREGLSRRYPYRAGSAVRGVVGTMVFSRAPLSRPERLATGFGSWRVQVGDDLSLMAVHTTAPSDPAGWRTDFDRLLGAVRETPPDLMLGDFNATADHEPMRGLDDAGFRDASEVSNDWRPTWPANHLGPGIARLLPPLSRIDHVLVGPDLAVLASGTVRIDGTDHLAVLARLARDRPPSPSAG